MPVSRCTRSDGHDRFGNAVAISGTLAAAPEMTPALSMPPRLHLRPAAPPLVPVARSTLRTRSCPYRWRRARHVRTRCGGVSDSSPRSRNRRVCLTSAGGRPRRRSSRSTIRTRRRAVTGSSVATRERGRRLLTAPPQLHQPHQPDLASATPGARGDAEQSASETNTYFGSLAIDGLSVVLM